MVESLNHEEHEGLRMWSRGTANWANLTNWEEPRNRGTAEGRGVAGEVEGAEPRIGRI